MNAQIKTAVVQFDVQKGQVDANLETVLEHLNALSKEAVQLALLPELFSCSYDYAHLAKHAERSDQILKLLGQAAIKHQMAIAGTLPLPTDMGISNAMVFIDTNGQVKGHYRKIHLFPLINEPRFFSAGDQAVVLDTRLGRIGMMICYDLRFPELARALCLNGAQIILVSAQWPAARQEQWEALIQARALENQLFIIGANRTGMEDDLFFSGGSVIAGPDGTILAKAKETENQVIYDIDFAKMDAIREQIPCIKDRRPDVYG